MILFTVSCQLDKTIDSLTTDSMEDYIITHTKSCNK